MRHFLSSSPQLKINSGYILPFVMVLMVILLLTSAGFFNRTVDSSRLSGYLRDSGQAQQLAEAAINRVTGRLISGIPDNVTRTPINDINGDNLIDRQQIRDVIPTLTGAPTGLLPSYVFYTAAGVLSASAPVATGTVSNVLQAVADGEAYAQNNLAINGSAIGSGAAPRYLRINNLFVSPNNRPLLFTNGAAGLQPSAAASWNAEPTPDKVAVWVELVANTTTQKMDIFVEAAAQSGDSRSYLQRRIGSHDYNQTLGGLVAPLSESGNRF